MLRVVFHRYVRHRQLDTLTHLQLRARDDARFGRRANERQLGTELSDLERCNDLCTCRVARNCDNRARARAWAASSEAA